MFKLFIYALLLYVLYRLLTGGRRKKTVGGGRKTTGSGELAAHDQLVEDPVCHIYIPKRQAIVLQDGDAVVYFCSEQCRKMYCDAHESDRRKNG